MCVVVHVCLCLCGCMSVFVCVSVCAYACVAGEMSSKLAEQVDARALAQHEAQSSQEKVASLGYRSIFSSPGNTGDSRMRHGKPECIDGLTGIYPTFTGYFCMHVRDVFTSKVRIPDGALEPEPGAARAENARGGAGEAARC